MVPYEGEEVMIKMPFAVTDPRLEALVDPRCTAVLAYNPPPEPDDKKDQEDRPKGPKSGPKRTR